VKDRVKVAINEMDVRVEVDLYEHSQGWMGGNKWPSQDYIQGTRQPHNTRMMRRFGHLSDQSLVK
jgi:hypothetical protein